MAQNNVGLLLKHINLEYTRLMDDKLRAHGVSTAQGEALYFISLNEGLSQSDLKKELGISAPSLSVLIDSLVAKELTERRPDPSDPRRIKLFLTAKASPLAIEISTLKQDIYTGLRKNMTEAQLAMLGELLERFLESLTQQRHSDKL
jgi:DNA-binding MarR family transcriptional regulator